MFIKVFKIRRGVLFGLLLFSLNIFSQITDGNISIKNKYLKYLLINDSTSHSSLLNIDFNYLYMPKNGAFVTKGTHLNLGLNLARFFTKKIILGISFDIKLFKGFNKQHFSSDFIKDFNSNFIATYENQNDSLLNYTVKGVVNQNNDYYIFGNSFSNIGIQYSPFPDRFGGIMLEIKKGDRQYRCFSPNTELSVTDDGYIYLDLKNCLTINLKFNPYKFFNSEKIILSEQKPKDFYKFIIVSLYYERLNLHNATILDKPLNYIVSQPFIDKYSKINSFGIKLGYGLY